MPSAIQAGRVIRSARGAALLCASGALTKGENNSEKERLRYLSCRRIVVARGRPVARLLRRPARLQLTTRLSRGLHRSALPNQTNFAASVSPRSLLANAAVWRLSSSVRGVSVETAHNSESAMAGNVKCFEMGTNGPVALKNNSAYLAYHHLLLLSVRFNQRLPEADVGSLCPCAL